MARLCGRARLPFRILIADGGADDSVAQLVAEKKSQGLDVEYVRYPFDSSYARLLPQARRCAARVTTPFVVMADNDDFFIPDGLEARGASSCWRIRSTSRAAASARCSGSPRAARLERHRYGERRVEVQQPVFIRTWPTPRAAPARALPRRQRRVLRRASHGAVAKPFRGGPRVQPARSVPDGATGDVPDRHCRQDAVSSTCSTSRGSRTRRTAAAARTRNTLATGTIGCWCRRGLRISRGSSIARPRPWPAPTASGRCGAAVGRRRPTRCRWRHRCWRICVEEPTVSWSMPTGPAGGPAPGRPAAHEHGPACGAVASYRRTRWLSHDFVHGTEFRTRRARDAAREFTPVRYVPDRLRPSQFLNGRHVDDPLSAAAREGLFLGPHFRGVIPQEQQRPVRIVRGEFGVRPHRGCARRD